MPPRHRRFAAALVSAEVALCLVILTAAGLLVGSFVRLVRTDPGFNPDGVATFRLNFQGSAGAQSIARTEVLQQIRRTPGVIAAGAIDTLPFSGARSSFRVRTPANPVPLQADLRRVTPNYFAAMGIALRDGRDFGSTDGDRAPSVVIVNQTAAGALWPGQSPIGQVVEVGGRRSTVIGLVSDVHHSSLAAAPVAEVYTAMMQRPAAFATLVVRTAGSPLSVVRGLQPQLEAAAGQPLSSLRTMDDLVLQSVHMPRFRAALFGLMALLVVVLAAVGIFSVTTHTVALRHREMGIRLAIGARPRQVIALVVRQALTPVFAGVGLGLICALNTTDLLSQFLYATAPTDGRTFVGVVLLVIVTALVSAWVPTLRTLRIDPVAVLRSE